jgi:hypothetical protein
VSTTFEKPRILADESGRTLTRDSNLTARRKALIIRRWSLSRLLKNPVVSCSG